MMPMVCDKKRFWIVALALLAAVSCGRKATVNARIDASGRIITEGDQVFLGGNDSYVAMCHQCWKRKIREQNTTS